MCVLAASITARKNDLIEGDGGEADLGEMRIARAASTL